MAQPVTIYDAQGQAMERAAATATIDQDGKRGVTAFSFGEPEPVLDRSSMLGYIESVTNGRWYVPPVSQCGLARAFDMPGPHASCIRLKVNLLVKHFVPSRWLDRANFRKWALDFLSLGNGYLELRDNLAGRPMQLRHALARYMRRGVDEGHFFFVPGWRQEHAFEPGHVHQLLQEHPAQEIYGVPEFFGALQAGLLGEAATLFRRRYYLNGSHAGFIFYASGAGMSNEDADQVREALRQSKGPGNFRNLFLHAPAGGKDDVKIIPISEVAAKDEFLNVKRVSRDEMLAAHRTPPQLVAIIPENNGGFGDVQKALDVFMLNEIEPLMSRMMEVNDWLGLKAVDFTPYAPPSATA
ncbi:phage portal protein [uncultured Croceicoccus sp.]|uniref:phage portal protein n=1 Tax=uncultured Croceicoccus sp. TaxID=1295329 RepID=UPI00261FDDDA|nr:phage portal protein [uncultured Croceicoccus sp.]